MRNLFVKRVFDLLAVLTTAPLWLPVMGGVALLVRWRLGAPVFFYQVRPGHREVPFEMLKFRTMLDLPDGQGGQRPDRDRLTPFGRWLRSTSLDELPELLNVLRGEMSLVGPRPLLMRYLARYSLEQRRRHEVPPGVTGWAQINGRNCINWVERFKLDIWYVDNHTLQRDITILFRTVVRVLQRRDINTADNSTMPEFGTDEVEPM